MTALPQTSTARAPRVSLKLREPLRRYRWPVIGLLLTVRVLAVIAADAWLGLLLVDLPLLVLLAAAVEAARASSHSTVDLLRRVVESHRQ